MHTYTFAALLLVVAMGKLSAATFDDTGINLHVIQPSYSGCSAVDASLLSCDTLDPDGDTMSGAMFVFVLVTQSPERDLSDGSGGMGSLRFGIEYEPSLTALSTGLCTGGSEIPQFDEPLTWPESGSGNAIVWPAGCFDTYENTDRIVKAYFFTMTGSGGIWLRDDPRLGALEAVDCIASPAQIPPARWGKAVIDADCATYAFPPEAPTGPCFTCAPTENAPTITSILDIDGDQGGWVRVTFDAAVRDDADETEFPISIYNLWRRVDDVPVPRAAQSILPLTEIDEEMFQATRAELPPGPWEIVGSFAATQQPSYQIAAPTLADSTEAGGVFHSVFIVSAHTTTPSVWYPSEPDSGYSTDDIAPGVPLNLDIAFNDPAFDLSWDASADDDFQHFRIYRGASPDFMPGEGTLVHLTIATSWQDTPPDLSAAFYKMTATDHAGNESIVGVFDPIVVGAGAPEVLPGVPALYANAPNPFRALTTIGFDLHRSAHVTLEVFDVSGRLVQRLVDESMPAGVHSVAWDGLTHRGSRASTGSYFYRLRAGDYEAIRRMNVIR